MCGQVYGLLMVIGGGGGLERDGTFFFQAALFTLRGDA